jgi:hypothetical protein
MEAYYDLTQHKIRPHSETIGSEAEGIGKYFVSFNGCALMNLSSGELCVCKTVLWSLSTERHVCCDFCSWHKYMLFCSDTIRKGGQDAETEKEFELL